MRNYFLRAASIIAIAASLAGRCVCAEPPPIPSVTVIADNPVQGLRLLAKEKKTSFQVFLWRANRYLDEWSRSSTLESLTLENIKKGI